MSIHGSEQVKELNSEVKRVAQPHPAVFRGIRLPMTGCADWSSRVTVTNYLSPGRLLWQVD